MATNTEATPSFDENDIVITEGKPLLKQVNPEDSRFTTSAAYWLNGLHNAEGIALSEEINQLIKKNKLEEDHKAIEALLAAYPNSKRFALQVVTVSQYLNDPQRRMNIAEPRYLLDGALVRDKNGAYRPAAGGRVILEDQGAALVLKSRSPEGYQAAMELALSKGWTAIELKGKPAMLADAWLEAKLKGLDVVNYSPTKEDLAKYSERMAQERVLNARAEASPQAEPEKQPGASDLPELTIQQSPEQVAYRPFVDANGENQVAQVTYTISQENVPDSSFKNVGDAAKAFASIAAESLPIVIRSVTRVGGYVEPDVTVAGTGQSLNSTQWVKSVDSLLDHEFSEAYAAVIEHEKTVAPLSPDLPVVSEGKYHGKIVSIDGNQVIQKTGRSPEDVTRHDLSRLSNIPKEGEVIDIRYENGRGLVKVKEIELGDDQGIQLSR
jgi:hypothetical protein